MSSSSSSDLLKIEHEMYLDLCFLCYCCYCGILLLFFICPCASTITDAEVHNCLVTTQEGVEQKQQKDQFTLIAQSFSYDDWSFYSCCYCVILLLMLLFMCSCGSTMTDDEQQQNETITSTTTTSESNLHNVLSVQNGISPIPMHDLPIQQLKMAWAKYCCWPPDVCQRGRGVHLPVPCK